jgi:hypothetical protein
LLFDLIAAISRPRARRIAVGVLLIVQALVDERAYVDGVVLADDDVVPARAERVSSAHCHLVAAGRADNLQAANHPPAVKIAVVKAILVHDVPVKPVQIDFRQELPGEEPGPAEALQASAHRAAAGDWLAVVLMAPGIARYQTRGAVQHLIPPPARP